MSTEHNKNGNRLYFMNDKNIHDGLLAQRVKAEHLNDFLLSKGIIVAENCSKENLLEIVQTMRFDYYDYVFISSLLENPDRRDSQSTTELPTKCDTTQVTLAINAVKKLCKGNEVELSLNIVGKKALVEVNYIDIDYSKAPMRQRTPKTGIIEIDFSGKDETSIRFPATDVGKKVKELILNEIKQNLPEDVKPIEIDFEYSKPKKRTEFFTKLISLPDYEVYDVVSVSVRNAAGEDEGSDITGQVRKAALSGQGLLTSDIYKSFPSEDYNIYKIIWKVQKIDGNRISRDSDCFTVEAKFDDIDKSLGFTYQVKSVQRYNELRKTLNVTPSKPSKIEVAELSKIIFKAAIGLYTQITREVQDE